MPATPSDSAPVHYDVVAMGSPLVDVLARVEEPLLGRLDLVKGSMALVDLPRAEQIYEALPPGIESSGGSAANTAAGVAALGGTTAFVGRIADDLLGQVFVHDIRRCGVAFEPAIHRVTDQVDPERLGTGRCLVLVTGDAERTMATHLGAASTIMATDVPEDLVSRAQVIYLEGYLWDLPPAQEAMRRAIAAAHHDQGAVAFSLSDPFCVERHQHEFLDLLLGDIDVLFANEEEIVRLFNASSFDRAVAAAEETGILMALTRGAAGCVVVTPKGPVEVPAAEVDQVVDTTGAGDLFAAGFLHGLTHGAGPVDCARLGGLCAAEVISHLGARPHGDLRQLAAEAGLLGD